MSLKTEKPLLFRAMHTTAKSMPGGVTALAAVLGRSEVVIANVLNPNVLDKVPSLDLFIQLLGLLDSDLVINALLDGTGFAAHRSNKVPLSADVFANYLDVMRKTGEATKAGSDALMDGVISDNERLQWLDLLHEQQNATMALMAALRGV